MGGQTAWFQAIDKITRNKISGKTNGTYSRIPKDLANLRAKQIYKPDNESHADSCHKSGP